MFRLTSHFKQLALSNRAQFSRTQLRFYNASRDEIRTRLIKVLHEQLKQINPKLQDKEITESTSFHKDLKLDSLDMVETVMAIEEEFSVEIDDTDFENIKTVKNAIEFIEKL